MIANPPRPCPTPRHHKKLGAAYLSFRTNGKRRTVYLGPWNSRAAEAKFRAFARLWPAQLCEDVKPGKWPRRRVYTFAGKSLTIAAWSAETGLSASAIRFRLDRGWDIERAVTTPTQRPYFERNRERPTFSHRESDG